MSLSGKDGSKLATNLKELGETKSIFGGLFSKDAAVSGLMHATLPESIRKALAPLVDESARKELEKEKDPTKREQAEKFFKAVEPAIKAGELDVAGTMRGPNKQGHYTIVAGVKLKSAKNIENILRDVFNQLPEKDRAEFKLDAESSGETKIHRVDVKNTDPEAARLFGSKPVYFAFRSDAVLVGAGADGLTALKDALKVEPKTAPPVLVELSLAHLAQALAKDQKAAPYAAKAAFKDDPDGGKIRVAVEGGTSLKIRMEMKTNVIKFFSLLDRAEK